MDIWNSRYDICLPKDDGGVTFSLSSKTWLEMVGKETILAGDDILSRDDQGRDDTGGGWLLKPPLSVFARIRGSLGVASIVVNTHTFSLQSIFG